MCVCTSKSLVSCDKISNNDNSIGSSMSLDNICGNSTQHLSVAWALTSLRVPEGTPKGLLGLRFYWVGPVGIDLGHGTRGRCGSTYMKDHYTPLVPCSIAGKSGGPFSNMAGDAVIPASLTLLAIFPPSSSACLLLILW